MRRISSAWIRDVLILGSRLLVASVMLAHVWDTFVISGFTSAAAKFSEFGIPVAIVATAATLVIELVGSVLLIVGLYISLTAGLLTFVMVGAIYFVHGAHGIFVRNNGWELVGMIIAAVLAIAAAGPGRVSVHYARSRKMDRVEPRTSINWAGPPPAHRPSSRPSLNSTPDIFKSRPVSHASPDIVRRAVHDRFR